MYVTNTPDECYAYLFPLIIVITEEYSDFENQTKKCDDSFKSLFTSHSCF